MKKQLLFVTYPNEGIDEGLSYAVDLAQTMNEGITVLLVKKDKLMKRFEDLMSSVAFAEENETDMARQLLSGAGTETEASQLREVFAIGTQPDVRTVQRNALVDHRLAVVLHQRQPMLAFLNANPRIGLDQQRQAGDIARL